METWNHITNMRKNDMNTIFRAAEMAIIFVGLCCLWIIYVAEKRIDENKEIIRTQETIMDTNSDIIDRQSKTINRQAMVINSQRDILCSNKNIAEEYKKYVDNLFVQLYSNYEELSHS